MASGREGSALDRFANAVDVATSSTVTDDTTTIAASSRDDNGAGVTCVAPACDAQVTKRSDYIDWGEYFMAVSFLSAMRSKDPATQVGACIVDAQQRIVGIGYNGMPRGCSDDVLPWCKNSADPLCNKYLYVCHAEMNAIMNRNAASLSGCTIFTVLFPCNECSKLIIQAGIVRVVYASDRQWHKPETRASKRLLDMAGVECVRFEPRSERSRIVIDFGAMDVVRRSSGGHEANCQHGYHRRLDVDLDRLRETEEVTERSQDGVEELPQTCSACSCQEGCDSV